MFEEKGSNPSKAKEYLRKADAIIFDVDGTLIQELPLEELSKQTGQYNNVLSLANNGVKTSNDYLNTLGQCTGAMVDNREVINKFLEERRLNLSFKARDLINALKKKGVDIYLVSGGFDCMFSHVAKDLGIPKENIFANKLEFFYDGTLAGMQTSMMFSTKAKGKDEVAKYLKKKYNYKHIVNVGDGLTDLEAQEVTDAFIAYGGNFVPEEVVIRSSMWYITNFNDMIEVLKKK